MILTISIDFEKSDESFVFHFCSTLESRLPFFAAKEMPRKKSKRQTPKPPESAERKDAVKEDEDEGDESDASEESSKHVADKM